MSQNPYIDQDTGIFKNKLGARTPEELHKIEYLLAASRGRELKEKPIQGNFDLDHMAAIHKHLLQDVYDWAGKPRTLNFSKRDPVNQDWSTPFCKVDNIKPFADQIAKEINHQNQFKGMNKDDFVKAITAVYTKVNYLHPFPEGNGRATQEFMKQLANGAGYELDFKAVNKVIWNQAAARTQDQVNRTTGETRKADSSLMQQVFNQITKPITQNHELTKQQKNDKNNGIKYSL